MNFRCSKKIEIPVLPLRDMVVYPYMITALFIGREISIKCIEFSMKSNKKILLIAQKESKVENPKEKDLFTVGTVSVILQMLKLPDGTIKILVKGLKRAKITELKKNNIHFLAIINYLKSPKIKKTEKIVLIKTTLKQFEKYITLNKKISLEVLR